MQGSVWFDEVSLIRYRALSNVFASVCAGDAQSADICLASETFRFL